MAKSFDDYEEVKIRCVGPNGEPGYGLVTHDQLSSSTSWEGPIEAGHQEILYDMANRQLGPPANAPSWLLVRHALEAKLEDYGATAFNANSLARVMTGAQAARWFDGNGFERPARLARQLEAFADLRSRIVKSYDAAKELARALLMIAEAGAANIAEHDIGSAHASLWIVEAANRAGRDWMPPHGMAKELDAVTETARSVLSDWRRLLGSSQRTADDNVEKQIREHVRSDLERTLAQVREWDVEALEARLDAELARVAAAVLGDGWRRRAPTARKRRSGPSFRSKVMSQLGISSSSFYAYRSAIQQRGRDANDIEEYRRQKKERELRRKASLRPGKVGRPRSRK